MILTASPLERMLPLVGSESLSMRVDSRYEFGARKRHGEAHKALFIFPWSGAAGSSNGRRCQAHGLSTCRRPATRVIAVGRAPFELGVRHAAYHHSDSVRPVARRRRPSPRLHRRFLRPLLEGIAMSDGNVFRLPTAAPRKVKQPGVRAKRAFREAHPWPGEHFLPFVRERMKAEAERPRLRIQDDNVGTILSLILLSVMDEKTRTRAKDLLRVTAKVLGRESAVIASSIVDRMGSTNFGGAENE